MTLEQLRTFAAVVKYGSIRAASSNIHKSAPSVSAAIKSLESYLEYQLFSRDGYRLVLTPNGQKFYDKAQHILRSVTELNALSNQKWKDRADSLTIAVDACFPQECIIRMIENMREEFPDTQLEISTEHLGGALEKLSLNKADLAITPLFGALEENRELKYLTSVPIIPVASPGLKIAQLASPVRQADILDETQILDRDSSQVSRGHATTRIAGAKSYCVTDINTKLSLILSGLGWGELPEHMVRDELHNGSLVKIDVEQHPSLLSEHYLIRKTDVVHSAVAQKLWETVCPYSELEQVKG
ncbi:LysR family transcriptional regulator [Neptunicella sp. SCSIO 80796]|uniref:LysR family transcriptional regulator n=1 Tax=Neptunicella plasticusilytica TaxID=3117012 RepID=UPI003A4D2C0C